MEGIYVGEKGNNDVCNIYTKLGSPPPCPHMNSMRLIIQVHPYFNHIFCLFSTHLQVLRRRRNAYPIEMGIISAINAVPHLPPFQAKMEEMEYSLYITGKESEWSCDVV